MRIYMTADILGDKVTDIYISTKTFRKGTPGMKREHVSIDIDIPEHARSGKRTMRFIGFLDEKELASNPATAGSVSGETEIRRIPLIDQPYKEKVECPDDGWFCYVR